jgi:glutaredoxin-related protein
LHGTLAVVGVGSNRVKAATALLQKHGLLGTEDIVEMTSRLYSCKNLIRDDQLEFKPESMSEKKHGIGVILLDDGMQVYAVLHKFIVWKTSW